MKQFISTLLLYAFIHLPSCHAMELATLSPQCLTSKIITEIPISDASFVGFIDHETVAINGTNKSDQFVCAIMKWKNTNPIATIPNACNAPAFMSPDKTMIALLNYHRVRLYDRFGTKKIDKTLLNHSGAHFEFTACNDVVFSHLNDRGLSLFNSKTDSIESRILPINNFQLKLYACHPTEAKKICVPSMEIHPNGYTLNLSICDLTTTRATVQTKSFLLQSKYSHIPQLENCTYNHDGSLLACSDILGNAYIANLITDTCTPLPRGIDERFRNIFFYDTSSVLATISYSITGIERDLIHFWDGQTIKEIRPPLLLRSSITTLAFCPDGNLLLLALADKVVITNVPLDIRYDLKPCIIRYLLFHEYNKRNKFLPNDIMRVLMQKMLNEYKR